MADVLNPPSGTSRRVAVPKYEPGVHPRYASGQSTVLGWVQVAAGAAVIVAAITARATYMNNLVIGDIFTGILVSMKHCKNIATGVGINVGGEGVSRGCPNVEIPNILWVVNTFGRRYSIHHS